MRVLLSTIGSRGDVQPLVALALELRTLGQEVRLCVPPDFRDWIESLGMPVTPIGSELRSTGKANPSAAPPSPERLRQLASATVATQFETIAAAAQGCDVIVGATALQIAARSAAERMGIRYVFVAYCPTVLPSPHHAPPPLGLRGDTPTPAPTDYPELWARDAERFNATFGVALNSSRASLGLAPVSDVRSHIFTDRPWLAADPTLGPWPDPEDQAVFQTGAWILPDERPLSPELETFLDAGEPPVYFGFGSIRASEDLSQVMIKSARALGRRAIVCRGWAELSLVDDEPDCLAIGEVNQQALFKRVAAVVHHGGAGTTTAAARAGTPQVVIPQLYDQHYWARRIHHLGIGTAHAPGTPTTDSLTSALRHALQPDVAARAQSIATAVRSDGAQAAARRLITADPQNSF
ncbi:Sterol 3-beta-glucosyltransferase [Scytonema sp. HK-05]|uniref:glycosyltransferase n=1 Tax=Scytonema sp. HK-05 TaxID=1137095 RepID=UPI000936F081|nr:glycosyltransferase [Scytonema sp. HK-05]OKH47968.1 glycosyl transferase [Scytonema sp. HK-05]BAY49611.1 Sterol 3-beta-glucosyltransferase [Scytonema sp. HK-05]